MTRAMTRLQIVLRLCGGHPRLRPSGAPEAQGGSRAARARHDVTMISADFGQEARAVVDGVKVENAYRPYAGIQGALLPPALDVDHGRAGRARPTSYQRTAGR